MSQMNRRQRQVYVYTAVVSAIAIINALFFLILYQPTRSEYFSLQESIRRLRAETANRSARLHQKEKILTQLETSHQDRTELVTKHFIPLDVGFVQVQPDLDRFAQRSGVRKSRIDESRDATPQFGLYSVKIKIPVQGSYSNIVNFVKEIENSTIFYIIRSIDVRSGGDSSLQGTPDAISLDMTLETFFYQ
jgi:Tfp pilus assembly protein PilO